MLSFLQTAVIYIVPFILVLTLVVTIHELGHFWAAKSFGVAIDRFSIGFGKAIASGPSRATIDWRMVSRSSWSGTLAALSSPAKAT